MLTTLVQLMTIPTFSKGLGCAPITISVDQAARLAVAAIVVAMTEATTGEAAVGMIAMRAEVAVDLAGGSQRADRQRLVMMTDCPRTMTDPPHMMTADMTSAGTTTVVMTTAGTMSGHQRLGMKTVGTMLVKIIEMGATVTTWKTDVMMIGGMTIGEGTKTDAMRVDPQLLVTMSGGMMTADTMKGRSGTMIVDTVVDRDHRADTAATCVMTASAMQTATKTTVGTSGVSHVILVETAKMV
mmetsp:Transcript_15857/g.26360  ORF Transcript_15857/g.26360 Transcript_15857/m.26360 type:complete len:241 (-) Transcript_15857:1112-1834(-)